MANPSTYAEYKATEDKAKTTPILVPFPRLAVTSTPKELLQVFFHARYHGRSKNDIMRMLDLAYQEISE